MTTRLVSLSVALVTACALVLTMAPPTEAAAPDAVTKAQRRLNDLGCNAGPADGDFGPWTRSAVIRFQSRHHMQQTGKLSKVVRKRLYSEKAQRCDRRPVPNRSGTGRRIVISQSQNWVWLVGPRGAAVAQGGMIDLPSELSRGHHATGSYCGRAGRIKRNTTASRQVWLWNFVRFAPCGIGFHRIPTYRSNGNQMHPDWYLGTNFTQSHGCIRLSKQLSQKIWNFTRHRTSVNVV